MSASGKAWHEGGPAGPRLSLGALPGPPAATMAATWSRRRAFCAAPASRKAVMRSDGAQSTFPNSCTHKASETYDEQSSQMAPFQCSHWVALRCWPVRKEQLEWDGRMRRMRGRSWENSAPVDPDP